MNQPETYTVTVRTEENFQGNGPCYVARDKNRDWHNFGKVSRAPGLTGLELAQWLYHPEDVVSVSVSGNITTITLLK